MEKIIYLVCPSAGKTTDQFRDTALTELKDKLLARENVRRLRMSFNDSDVSRADGLKYENRSPLPLAMLSLWVDTANTSDELVALIRPYVDHVEGYLVTESEVMRPPARAGQRTPGTLQLCTLEQLPELSREAFLTTWKDSHGAIAIDTQSTFGYRQNLVVRKLTENAHDHTAIVEEHFPADAMDSQHVFYDAVGDDEKLERNFKAMMASCARFIDQSSINVVHMSEYDLTD